MNSTPADSSSAAAPATPLGVRVLRGLALLGLALILTLLLGLALVSAVPLARDAVASLFDWSAKTSTTAGVITVAFIVLVPLALLALAWRRRLRSWWWIGGGYLAAAPVLAYLAIDDATLRHPVTIDEIAPAFPGAERSFAVLMRYGKNQALARDFRAPSRIHTGQPLFGSGPTDAKAWETFLRARRADIEADWAELAPVQAWWAELAAFERIGDLTAPSYEAEIMAFNPTRTYAQHAVAIASLQALDGRGDEAMATLLPVLQVGRRLQPSARTLVRFMIAIVVEKMAMQTATFVLEHAAVSPAMQARLAAALEGGCRGEAGARRLVGIEYALQVGALVEKPLGDLMALNSERDISGLRRHFFNAVGPLVYNPQRTLNLMGDLNAEYQELAARRDPLFATRGDALVREKCQPQFKNLFGSALALMAMPAYSKVVQSYWSVQDMRDALAARVRGRT
jgi:hypothetical protein